MKLLLCMSTHCRASWSRRFFSEFSSHPNRNVWQWLLVSHINRNTRLFFFLFAYLFWSVLIRLSTWSLESKTIIKSSRYKQKYPQSPLLSIPLSQLYIPVLTCSRIFSLYSLWRLDLTILNVFSNTDDSTRASSSFLKCDKTKKMKLQMA